VLYIVGVTVYVKEEFREAFINETLVNARNTRKEPGNLRFDVLQSLEDPNRFFLYEVYTEEASMIAHKATEHYKKWRENVAPMMAKPREGIKYTNLFPETSQGFKSIE